MARPLVPLPISPQLRHWHGSQSFGSLSNRFVSERLRNIDPAGQPFFCVELCNEFLGWRAENCSDQMQFGAVVRKLEMMLMWSFHRGISLLSWEAGLAVEFLKFWKHPPAAWTMSTTHLCLIPGALRPWVNNSLTRLRNRRRSTSGVRRLRRRA